MSNRLVIIGAGGHGKVIADNALKNGYTNICFVDDHATGECVGFPIIGTCDDIDALNNNATDFIIAIGNNAIRKQFAEQYHVRWATLIHPSAQIGLGVSIGEGTVVNACAVINSCATVGVHCIVNTGAIVEHDNMIGDYVHISPGVKLSGTVSVGDSTWIGTGTSVINNIEICDNVIIGVGAVVVRDVKDKGTYFGTVSR